MVAYVLTDWPVMQALTRAADRGVKVRIYLDDTQLAVLCVAAREILLSDGRFVFVQPALPLKDFQGIG